MGDTPVNNSSLQIWSKELKPNDGIEQQDCKRNANISEGDKKYEWCFHFKESFEEVIVVAEVANTWIVAHYAC